MKSEPVFGIAALLFDLFPSVYFIKLYLKKYALWYAGCSIIWLDIDFILFSRVKQH